MKTLLLKSLAALTLSAAVGTVMAQQSAPAPTGGASGTGFSGSSGLNIDFFASNTPGDNTEKGGGFADAIEKAFGTPSTDCGKLKCDQ